MNENERGVIQHQERAKQLILFEDMKYDRKITPTDFDAVIEYKDVAWVVCEVKYKDTTLPYGQELALNRFVDDMWRAGKHVLAIVAEHEIDNANENIMLKDCIVRKSKYNHEDWISKPEKITVKQCVDKFLEVMDERIKGRSVV